MIDINLEEIYEDLKNTNQYDGFKERALSEFITFARADMTVQDVMNAVYCFNVEDNKPLIDVSAPHWIMNVFAIKMASIHYGCRLPELDEQVLSIINENMLIQYKDYYSLFDYQKIRCDIINIFISDAPLYNKVSEKARDLDRISNNSFFDFQSHNRYMLIDYFNSGHTISEVFNEFVKEYLTKT